MTELKGSSGHKNWAELCASEPYECSSCVSIYFEYIQLAMASQVITGNLDVIEIHHL